MIHYGKNTLDHFRKMLNDEQGYGASALNYVFDTMSDYGIPDHRASDTDAQIRDFLTQLLPEIVNWLDRRAQEVPGEDFHLTYIDDVQDLISRHNLRTLAPYFIRIMNKNNRNVIKQLLFAIKNQFNWHEAQKTLLMKQIRFMKNAGIDWPELDTIIKGVKSKMNNVY